MSLIIGSLSPPTFFYGGEVALRFDEPKWQWYRVNSDSSYDKVYGVTKTVKIIDKSEVLMAWAKKQAMFKLRRLMLERHLGPDECVQLFVAELDQIITEAKQADKEILDAAGATGHDAHEWIEQYILATTRQDRDVPAFPEDPRAAKCCTAALEWMRRHNVRWVSTERKVYSKRYNFAGTLDGLATIDSCHDPLCCKTAFQDRLSIVDWKTSNYLYLEYLLQTAAYWQAHTEETGEVIKDRWIIRLGKEDAEFDPWHAEGEQLFKQDFNAFWFALRLVQAIEGIDARVQGVKDERRAALKEIERIKKEAADKIKCPKADDYKGSRLSKCLPDRTQCQACAAKYAEKHSDDYETQERIAIQEESSVQANG
jgi:hypothetical protein